MQTIIPAKLQPGDEIRILTPSDSLVRVGGKKASQIAQDKLESWGFKVTFGEHVLENDFRESSSIQSRIADLHAAFLDPNVKAILAVIGGFTSNELLPYLDFDLIQQHPKIICGFSDFTALANAITAKTGLVTYYGPAFATLKMQGRLGDYQDQYWRAVLTNQDQPVVLQASSDWTSDAWYDPKTVHKYQPNRWQVYHAGRARGVTVGGNANTFYLLQGTEYQPELKNNVLLVEFSEDVSWLEFSRNLASLLQIAEKPQALLIGRFPLACGMTEERLKAVLDLFPVLQTIPVMYNLNFGHAQPIFTIPLGQKVIVDTSTQTIQF